MKISKLIKVEKPSNKVCKVTDFDTVLQQILLVVGIDLKY